ncbi:LOW QUALITY PROTEIN: hypothetical protein M8C21_011065 [Ambrosia artemisiifolia]|uniref:Uncharacterized protein n=1 Tax=Ambrosia artemisiifolia TaxID=4212 RepID=A0AAD5CTS8_AMBAR|nr:LOW QUALITY PROTEIN: hypothetical protein M8C21_011065 [Ambrosia artemisiifolia]
MEIRSLLKRMRLRNGTNAKLHLPLRYPGPYCLSELYIKQKRKIKAYSFQKAHMRRLNCTILTAFEAGKLLWFRQSAQGEQMAVVGVLGRYIEAASLKISEIVVTRGHGDTKLSPQPRSPGPGSRVGTTTTSPFHQRLACTSLDSPNRKLDDGENVGHPLPLPHGSPSSPSSR